MAWAFQILRDASKMPSKEVVPIYSPTCNIWKCLFYQNLISSLSVFMKFANWMVNKYVIVVCILHAKELSLVH